MPIFFNVEQARNQLLRNGVVYTARKLRSSGITIARYGSLYKFTVLGKVNVRHVAHISSPEELQPYLSQSGFNTIADWVQHIKYAQFTPENTLDRYIQAQPSQHTYTRGIELYRVELIGMEKV